MRLYLDDDSVSRMLVRLLAQAGHDVEVPADVGLSGQNDPVHLTHAASLKRVLLTGNHDDYRELHELVVATGGVHAGILIVRRDNDPRRDMSQRAIARSIDNLGAAMPSLANQLVIVNHWR